MKKINGIILEGKVYEVIETGKLTCKECPFYSHCSAVDDNIPCAAQIAHNENSIYRYSPELTSKLNSDSQPTKLATVRATGKTIEVAECTDYNSGTVYYLDVNNDDADPYDYRDLDFYNTKKQMRNENVADVHLHYASACHHG